MGNSREEPGTTAWDVKGGKLNSAQNKLWQIIGQDGGKIVERLDTDHKFRERVAECMLLDGYSEPPETMTLRDMFGGNFFGIREWKKFFGLDLSQIYNKIPAIPWSRSDAYRDCPFIQGKEVCDTHFLFLAFHEIDGKEMGIREWAKMVRGQDWVKINEPFPDFAGFPRPDVLTDGIAFHWYCVPLEPVPSSHGRTYEEQEKMLPATHVMGWGPEIFMSLILRLRLGQGLKNDCPLLLQCSEDSGMRIWTSGPHLSIHTTKEKHCNLDDCVAYASMNPPKDRFDEYLI